MSATEAASPIRFVEEAISHWYCPTCGERISPRTRRCFSCGRKWDSRVEVELHEPFEDWMGPGVLWYQVTVRDVNALVEESQYW